MVGGIFQGCRSAPRGVCHLGTVAFELGLSAKHILLAFVFFFCFFFLVGIFCCEAALTDLYGWLVVIVVVMVV